MEVSIGDYGRMVFELMMGARGHGDLPDHWKSIESKARPLVEQLLALNSQMKGGGYQIHGYKSNGKVVLPNWERAREARKHDWQIKQDDVKEGDFVFLFESEAQVDESEPYAVEFVKYTGHGPVIGIDLGRMGVYKVREGDILLRCPEDWEAYGQDHWLKRADELGL